MVFHSSLSESKSSQVSRTLLSILSVLINTVVWRVSTRLPTSNSSSRFYNLLLTAPKAPITIGIIVTCMFLNFFQYSSKVEVLILLFTFFQFYTVVSRYSKVDNFAIVVLKTHLGRWTIGRSGERGSGISVLPARYDDDDDDYYYHYYLFSFLSFSHQR